MKTARLFLGAVIAAPFVVVIACGGEGDGTGTDTPPFPSRTPTTYPSPKTDAGSGNDSGVDTGSDSGGDTGADIGSDSGADTGSDSGADTGSDSGADTGTPPILVNLALGKTATQIDTYNSYGGASHAVDGNTDGNYFNSSVTHTASTTVGTWWQVDLGATSSVDHVTLWNRTDCCSERLTNFDVQTSTDGTTWTSHLYPGTAPTTTNIPIGGSVRYVKVVLLNSGSYLSLAEVQVWGN
jgi:hypothetical protein